MVKRHGVGSPVTTMAATKSSSRMRTFDSTGRPSLQHVETCQRWKGWEFQWISWEENNDCMQINIWSNWSSYVNSYIYNYIYIWFHIYRWITTHLWTSISKNVSNFATIVFMAHRIMCIDGSCSRFLSPRCAVRPSPGHAPQGHPLGLLWENLYVLQGVPAEVLTLALNCWMGDDPIIICVFNCM